EAPGDVETAVHADEAQLGPPEIAESGGVPGGRGRVVGPRQERAAHAERARSRAEDDRGAAGQIEPVLPDGVRRRGRRWCPGVALGGVLRRAGGQAEQQRNCESPSEPRATERGPGTGGRRRGGRPEEGGEPRHSEGASISRRSARAGSPPRI